MECGGWLGRAPVQVKGPKAQGSHPLHRKPEDSACEIPTVHFWISANRASYPPSKNFRQSRFTAQTWNERSSDRCIGAKPFSKFRQPNCAQLLFRPCMQVAKRHNKPIPFRAMQRPRSHSAVQPVARKNHKKKLNLDSHS